MQQRFFLGSNTPNGFYGRFNDMLDISDCIILKGSAGCGKSTIIKKICAEAQKKGLDCELYYCSGDPSSLDGAYIPELKKCILDGTSPHTVEPTYTLVNHFVFNLLQNADYSAPRNNAAEIVKLINQKKQYFKRAYSYLNAFYCKYAAETQPNKPICENILFDVVEDIFNYADFQRKTERRTLFFAAVTPDGITDFSADFRNVSNVISVNCADMASVATLFELLKTTLKSKRIPYATYLNPLNPDECSGLGFCGLTVLVNNNAAPVFKSYNLDDSPAAQTPDTKYDDLFEKAVHCFDLARKTHIETESLYAPAIDFSDVDRQTERILSLIFA